MIYKRKDGGVGVYALLIFLFACVTGTHGMSDEERIRYKEETKALFYHGYDGYMRHAFPADELMPLSCRGRWRDSEPNRGDIDDVLGNFSLTLIDTLDTLIVMGNLTEFERGVNEIIKRVQFDSDIVVSVFELNIRVLGGLLSGHVFAEHVRQEYNGKYLPDYSGELLALARDIGNRLLPAFNTSTGIPHPRVNLRHGMASNKIKDARDTCTACAGTMILEFAALSRLTNDLVYEKVARKAMDYLWERRHRTSELVGSVLNIHNGDWIRRESGVGAGIDSYYEYLFKGYMLLGDETYLSRFNRHYEGIMTYIKQGPLLLDVHMHRPRTNAKNFMDSLLAFWPGLQVMKGDIVPAIQTHELLYQVMEKHDYLLPEAFNVIDFNPHWAEFLIRPEFIESTYFLHKATGDSYYLEVGKKMLESIRKYTLTDCGFASLRDVRTGKKDDRMDSFVLSETLKYLYLLFADASDLIIDIDQYVFTTEAHLLPLRLSTARHKNRTSVPPAFRQTVDVSKRFCPDLRALQRYSQKNQCPFTKKKRTRNETQDYAAAIRANMKGFVRISAPIFQPNHNQPAGISSWETFQFRGTDERLTTAGDSSCAAGTNDGTASVSQWTRVRPEEFNGSNAEHLSLLREMGIQIVSLADGRIQLLQDSSRAYNTQAAQEGTAFMQKMLSLSKQQAIAGQWNAYVSYVKPNTDDLIVNIAGAAQFGADLTSKELRSWTFRVQQKQLIRACDTVPESIGRLISGKIALVERGDCMFVQKVRNVLKHGALAVIVIDNTEGTSSETQPIFSMSGDEINDVDVPVVFLYRKEGMRLIEQVKNQGQLFVCISNQNLSDLMRKELQKKKVLTEQKPEQKNSKKPQKNEMSRMFDSTIDSMVNGMLQKMKEQALMSEEIASEVQTLLKGLSGVFDFGKEEQQTLVKSEEMIKKVIAQLDMQEILNLVSKEHNVMQLFDHVHGTFARVSEQLSSRGKSLALDHVNCNVQQFIDYVTRQIWVCT